MTVTTTATATTTERRACAPVGSPKTGCICGAGCLPFCLLSRGVKCAGCGQMDSPIARARAPHLSWGVCGLHPKHPAAGEGWSCCEVPPVGVLVFSSCMSSLCVRVRTSSSRRALDIATLR